MSYSLDSVSPVAIPITGGTELVLVGTWPIDQTALVHLGPLGTTDDPLCYGGQGLGYEALSLDGETLRVASPPLDLGVAAVTVEVGSQILTPDTPISVVERNWPGKLHGIRSSFPPWKALGARRLAEESLLELEEDVPQDLAPQGTWLTVSTVGFDVRLGRPMARLTLQDGFQRVMPAGTWDISNGVVDWGYDEAASQGNSKWLYFYAVPGGSGLVVRASDNPPSVGPAGYSLWRLVWVTYMGSGGELRRIHQSGNRFELSVPIIELSGTSGEASPTQRTLIYCPESARAVELQAFIQTNGSGWCAWRLWPDDGAGTPTDTDAVSNMSCHASTGASDSGTVRGVLPLIIPQQIYYRRQIGSGLLLTSYLKVCSWIDGWIDP